jgi:site-specific DNA-methyltransferase (adenine-specific)
VPALDVITNIPQIHNRSPERVGYPTQKPLSLLKHVLELSTNGGDLVLDPFCGCGTSIIASEQLGRRWIGIDIGDEAIKTLREKRIPKEAPEAVVTEKIEPFDGESTRLLADLDEGYEFQWWAVRKLGGQPPGGKPKKGADRGQDGEIFIETQDEFQRRHRVIISVKSGGKPGVRWVTELADAVNNPVHQAHMGILVTLAEPNRNLRDRAREYGPVPGTAGAESDPYKIQIVTAAELLRLGPKSVVLPGVNVTPFWKPRLPIPERVEQAELPVDTRPQKDRRRVAALVADNTGKAARRSRRGPVKVAEIAPVQAKQTVLPGSGGSFRLTPGRTGRKK